MSPERRTRPSRSLEQWIRDGYRPHIVLKFDDGVDWPYEDGVERHFTGDLARLWEELRRDFPRITIQRLVPMAEAGDLALLERQARAAAPEGGALRLTTCFAVECPPDRPLLELAERLGRLPRVECAYPEAPPAPPPTVFWQDDPLFAQHRQGYLEAPPRGVGIQAAWNVPGGDGAGVRVADLEQGWIVKHPDLPWVPVHGVNHEYREHGLAALGILLARDNALGCLGAVPHAHGEAISEFWKSVSSPFRPYAQAEDGLWHSRALSLACAALQLGRGDVLLVESQLEVETGTWGQTDYEYHCVPVEYETINRRLIGFATARGITVVEAAGDGMECLDDASLGGAFARARPDSGAIVVAAGRWVDGPAPLDSGFVRTELLTNWGSRVDCFSWGRGVVSLGPPGTPDPGGLVPAGYVSDFSETSSASAIVAGCAAAVQGYARWRLGQPLTPERLRELLRDPALNTRTRADRARPPSDTVDAIGVQPNLVRVLEHLRLQEF